MSLMREYVERRMLLLPRVIMPLNRNGAKLDTVVQKKLVLDHRRKVATWRSDMKKHFKKLDLGEIPVGAKGSFSYPKLKELLYETLELPEQYSSKPPHGVTTDKKAMEKLAKKDKTGTVPLLLVRSRAKAAETAIQVKADRDGRVRTRFVLGGDEKSDQNETGKPSPSSGRLSSRDPNLQNIKEWARMLYVPTHKAGWILKADYSQIEMRIIALLSGDEELQAALDQDAHLFIMWKVDQISNLWGLHKRGWKKLLRDYKAGNVKVVEARDECKRIAYGWAYRMGAGTMENVKGIPFAKGKVALQALNEVFWRVPGWWDELVRKVRSSAGGSDWGFLQNQYGRVRNFLLSDVPKICNFFPQGLAADILYDAMEVLIPTVPKMFPGTMAILTIHDELVFDVHPSTDVIALADYIKEIMEWPVPELDGLVVPVDIMVGKNWAKKHICTRGCAIPPNPTGQVKLAKWKEEHAA